jgi:hypothetical protein
MVSVSENLFVDILSTSVLTKYRNITYIILIRFRSAQQIYVQYTWKTKVF